MNPEYKRWHLILSVLVTKAGGGDRRWVGVLVWDLGDLSKTAFFATCSMGDLGQTHKEHIYKKDLGT